MQKKSHRYVLSYSPGGSTRREVVPGGSTRDTIFAEGEAVGAMAPFERAMVVSCIGSPLWPLRYLTIRPQFAIECLRRSNH